MIQSKQSKWLKVFCPEEACLREEERIGSTASGPSDRRSSWLALFCPQSGCEFTAASQLP
jgi:hypothetical protein